MRLNNLTKETICFLTNICERKGEPVTIDELKESCNVSTGQAAIICKFLRDHDMIGTLRGRSGGVFLAKHPEEIKIADIITRLEAKLRPIDCFSPANCSECKRFGGPAFCAALSDALSAFYTALADKTLQDLCSPTYRVEKKGQNPVTPHQSTDHETD
ncbi:Rrf2 family transcriptional regulator [Labrenzia sp. R4_2]|uniref:RrF2 family transcriptional regulator n=1 Tax=Labrenzia sp. R4_2 TaxID=2821107 RepID=UPI001ADABF0D|nr:Rrf2 family transcriptional regulator [Labrenzia sp. R4_2]MBO9422380.1 Rrf2 family transcriptional regulator [Labrenzia sp. R4_2]